MSPKGRQRLYELAGPMGPMGDLDERMAADEAWVAERTLEDARDMLEALGDLPGPWVRPLGAVTLVGDALAKIGATASEALLPTLVEFARRPGLARVAAIDALGELPDGVGLDTLLALDPRALDEEAQRSWAGSLSDLKLPESLARLKAAAEDGDGPEAAREEARRLLEGHR